MTQPSDAARGAQLSLAEVAEACGVSLSTVKRKQGQFAHAYKDPRGVWRVPVGDLLAAGFQLRSWSSSEVAESLAHGLDPVEAGQELAQARSKIEELAAQLATERIARAAAEARAEAYRDNLTDLRRSLNALSGPLPVPPATDRPEPTPVQPAPVHQPPRRRWPWSRR